MLYYSTLNWLMNGLYDILIYDDSHAAAPLIKGIICEYRHVAGPLLRDMCILPTIVAASLIEGIIYKYRCAAGPLFEGYLHFT